MKKHKNQAINKNNSYRSLFLYALLIGFLFTLSLSSSCAFLGHKKHKTSSLPSEREQKEGLARALSGRGKTVGKAIEKGEELADDLLESVGAFFSRFSSKAKHIEHSKFNTSWKEWGENILQRSLTETEAKALSDAYYIRYFTPENARPFRPPIQKDLVELVNFTDNDIKNLLLKERKWILNQAGFTDEEIDLLLLSDTQYKNMFDKERHINKQSNTLYEIPLNDKLPPEIQALVKPLDESRQHLRESLEAGELKEGVSPYVVVQLHKNIIKMPYKIVKINSPNEITVQGLDGELKTLIDFHILPIIQRRDMPDHLIDIASPEVSQLFAAIGSNRRRVSIEELNLPQKRDLPPPPYSFYGPEYRAGWSQIQEGIAFAKAIRELDPPPNPYKTHIEWFVPQIPNHIENARQILRQLQKPEELPDLLLSSDNFMPLDKIRDMLKKIDLLEQQALKTIREEQVTYSWWLNFNSELITTTVPRVNENNQMYLDDLSYVTNYFPINIFLPIKPTDSKNLGIMSMNRSYQNNIAPIEISSTPFASYDGVFNNSLGFYTHDIQHAITNFRRRPKYDYLSFPLREAEKTHLQFMDSLEREERIQMENIYFLTTHEGFRVWKLYDWRAMISGSNI